MTVNLEYSKTLAGVGAILVLLSFVPYAGLVLGLVGVVLLLIGIKDFANYYGDQSIYQNSWTGVKYYIVAVVAAAVGGTALAIGIGSATAFAFASISFTVGLGVGIAVFLAGLVVAFVFYVLAATHLRKTFNSLAQKTGEASFTTAGNLLWWGSILTIVLVGLVLIPIAWIFATNGFFTMKSRQYQQYAPQPNGYTTQPQQNISQ